LSSKRLNWGADTAIISVKAPEFSSKRCLLLRELFMKERLHESTYIASVA
jgi:hypothetical protein